MPDEHLDTAALRPATGLDEGARHLILRVVAGVGNMDFETMVSAFFHDRYGGVRDYLEALNRVWGYDTSRVVEDAISSARANAEFPASFGNRVHPDTAAALAILLRCPEPDFRKAVTSSLAAAGKVFDGADRITKICRERGIPWEFLPPDGFVYTGDELTEELVTRPALAAINRAEFSGGVKSEFESARAELATGTPTALKQAVHEAGNAVESAMKVVLDKHGVGYSERATAKPLFEELTKAGILPTYMEHKILAASVPRNKKAGHGAGAVAHNVDPAEAEAVVNSAAGAIAYLATKLP